MEGETDEAFNEKVAQFEADLSNTHLNDVTTDNDLHGDLLSKVLDTLNYWAQGVIVRMMAKLESYKDWTTGEPRPLFRRQTDIKHIVRAILLANDKTHVDNFLDTILDAEYKTKCQYGFSLVTKIAKKMADDGKVHLLGFLLQYLNNQVFANNSVRLFTNDDISDPNAEIKGGLRGMVTQVYEQLEASFLMQLNEVQNTSNFWQAQADTSDNFDFVTQYKNYFADPYASAAIPNPVQFFIYKGSANYVEGFDNYLKEKQSLFATNEDVKGAMDFLQDNLQNILPSVFAESLHINIPTLSVNLNGRTRFTIDSYQAMLKGLFEAQALNATTAFMVRANEVQSGALNYGHALANEQEEAQYNELLALLQMKRIKPENLQVPDFKYEGTGVVLRIKNKIYSPEAVLKAIYRLTFPSAKIQTYGMASVPVSTPVVAEKVPINSPVDVAVNAPVEPLKVATHKPANVPANVPINAPVLLDANGDVIPPDIAEILNKPAPQVVQAGLGNGLTVGAVLIAGLFFALRR